MIKQESCKACGRYRYNLTSAGNCNRCQEELDWLEKNPRTKLSNIVIGVAALLTVISIAYILTKLFT